MQPDVGAEHMQAYGREPSLIVSDPAKHDKQRRQVMRHFAPPHSPNVIPDMAADIQTLCNAYLDRVKANGGHTFDVVDQYAYPVPVAVICKILGVPLKDEPIFHGGFSTSWPARTWDRMPPPRREGTPGEGQRK